MNLLPVVLLLNRRKKNGENINRSAVFIALCLIFDIYAVVPTHMRQWTAMAPIKKERFVQHSPAFYLQNVLYILYVASSIQPECGLWCLMPVMRILRVLYHIDRLLERTRADVFFLFLVPFSLLAFGGYNDRWLPPHPRRRQIRMCSRTNTPNRGPFYIHEIIPASIECACAQNSIQYKGEKSLELTQHNIPWWSFE